MSGPGVGAGDAGRIAAVIPVWNGREWLERLLDSLARQTRPAAETIVVDNGSTDGADELRALARRARDRHGPQRRIRRGGESRHWRMRGG